MSKNAVMPLSDYKNACDAIREKTGSTDLIKSGDMAEKIMGISGGGDDGSYNEGFEDGKKAEYDVFWDIFQQNGERTWYWGAFTGPGWTDEIFKPKYPIIAKGTCGYCFRNSKITNVLYFEYLDTTVTQTFYDALNLKTIGCFKLTNGGNKFTQVFANCKELENLTMEGVIGGNGFDVSASTKLTHDSLMSIIRALKDFSTLITFVNETTLTSTTYSKISDNALTEGKTYFTTFYAAAYSNTEPIIVDNPRTAKTENVYGVGERVAIHYDLPYWSNPQFTYHFVLYQDGQDLKELRYIQNNETNTIFANVSDPRDRIESIKTKQGDGTHTVTLGSTNLAKLTDAEKVQATEKGWTLL